MKNFTKNLKISIVASITFLFSFNSKSQSNVDYGHVKEIANETAYALMKRVSPNTGFNSYAKVSDWNYNSLSKTITIKVEAYWTAKRYMLASNYESFNIDGVLTIDLDDNDVDFSPTYKNTSVRYAWTGADAILATTLTYALLANN